jgi:hypothetical protein
MNVSKIGKIHVVSFDMEDVSIAWSQGNYPFLLDEELTNTVLSGALEDCKDKLRDIMYESIRDQLFKPR